VLSSTDHTHEIIASFGRTGNMAETARFTGVTRQRVHQIISDWRSGRIKKAAVPEHFTDTGCPDGSIPSCLECPLPACLYDEPGD